MASDVVDVDRVLHGNGHNVSALFLLHSYFSGIHDFSALLVQQQCHYAQIVLLLNQHVTRQVGTEGADIVLPSNDGGRQRTRHALVGTPCRNRNVVELQVRNPCRQCGHFREERFGVKILSCILVGLFPLASGAVQSIFHYDEPYQERVVVERHFKVRLGAYFQLGLFVVRPCRTDVDGAWRYSI